MGAGVIVAGGRSTRFGERDKAVADLAGTPMIRRVVDRIAGVTDELGDDVRGLQRVMFTDDDWIREFHEEYSLRSVLFRRAADGIERTAEELGQPTET